MAVEDRNVQAKLCPLGSDHGLPVHRTSKESEPTSGDISATNPNCTNKARAKYLAHKIKRNKSKSAVHYVYIHPHTFDMYIFK